MDEDAHGYSPRYYFLSISQRSGFCIMKLMTCLLTEVRLFFCGGACLSRGRLCRCSFTYVFGCLCACLFGVNECCGGLRISGWSSLSLFFFLFSPPLTPGILLPMIDTPHLNPQFPAPAPLPSTRARFQGEPSLPREGGGATRSGRPAVLKPPVLLHSRSIRAPTPSIQRGALATYPEQINITSLGVAVNLPVSPAPSITLQDGNKRSRAIWLCVKIISFKLLHD